MARQRIYDSGADRQAAYRERCRVSRQFGVPRLVAWQCHNPHCGHKWWSSPLTEQQCASTYVVCPACRADHDMYDHS